MLVEKRYARERTVRTFSRRAIEGSEHVPVNQSGKDERIMRNTKLKCRTNINVNEEVSGSRLPHVAVWKDVAVSVNDRGLGVMTYCRYLEIRSRADSLGVS